MRHAELRVDGHDAQNHHARALESPTNIDLSPLHRPLLLLRPHWPSPAVVGLRSPPGGVLGIALGSLKSHVSPDEEMGYVLRTAIDGEGGL